MLRKMRRVWMIAVFCGIFWGAILIVTTISYINLAFFSTVYRMYHQCSVISPNLIGNNTLGNSFELSLPAKREKQLEDENPLVQQGGSYSPEHCIPKYKVAVIIPFRNRYEHLLTFLQYMHPLFQRQQLDYKIFVINEIDGAPFNRAKLMNVGFVEAFRSGYDCFVFHDVDMILEDDRCPISCDPKRPGHLGAYLHRWNYTFERDVGYKNMGGVAQFTKEQFLIINGMSNLFWGWGGEDDDLYTRTLRGKLRLKRYKECRYRMIKHSREAGNMPNPERHERLKQLKIGYSDDGVGSLDYKVIMYEIHRLYTNITVDLYAPK